LAENDSPEKDAAAQEREEACLHDLLPVLLYVLFAKDSKADVDKDEQTAEEAANNADNDSRGQVKQRRFLVAQLAELQGAGVRE